MSNKKLTVAICIICFTVMSLYSAGCWKSGTKADRQPPVPNGQKEQQLSRQPADDGWKPISYDKKVKPYQVNGNLSNIENITQFGGFTPVQKQMLAKNGFVVTPSDEEQLFYVYENNEYLRVPSFITTDSVLHTYHVFFDYSLRTLENKKLLGILEKLTDSMLKESVIQYNQIKNPAVKSAALKNAAFFAVAQKALGKGLPADLPVGAKKMAEKEYGLISGEAGFQQSFIFPYELDYSQYIPRGHYTRNDAFKRYFKAMMWYGQAPFPLYIDKDGRKEINVEQTIQALLITDNLFFKSNNKSDLDMWEQIYRPTTFYVGSTDDLNIYHYKDLLVKVHGPSPNLNNLANGPKMAELEKAARKLPEPRIQGKWVTVNTPSGKQFRFMGQRYIPDSEILQKLVQPFKRPMPKGLDVMGVLGSDRAYDLLINMYKENEKWDRYTNEYAALEKQFSKVSGQTWRSNMYYGWLWVLKSLINKFAEGFPSFMTNTAWEDKSLNTALGSWAELRHDTILYGKQSGAEAGGDMPPVVKSYVEPNVEAYERLLWLTKYSRESLTAQGILPDDLKERMQNFEELLDFLLKCSIKELRNEELTKEEYDRLLSYGGNLEYLTNTFIDSDSAWFEVLSETDKNMALIADVHTVAPNHYLEEGVGSPAQIYVVVPINGKLYMTRGAIFSYYEFISDLRLTDEDWQKRIKANKQPPQPEWTKSFMTGKKSPLPVPKI